MVAIVRYRRNNVTARLRDSAEIGVPRMGT